MKRILIIFAALALAAIVAGVVVRARGRAAAPHYVTVPVTYRDVTATVSETGTVNPVDEVQVGTQVSGTIEKLDVDYNSVVKAGQVLAVLDPTSFQAAQDQAQGTLAAAQAQAAAQAGAIQQSDASVAAAQAGAAQQRANALAAQANIAKAQAQLKLDRTTVARDSQLLSEGYIAPSQADADATAVANDEAALHAAQASYAAAQMQADAAASQVHSAQAQRSTTLYQARAAQAQIQSANGQAQQAAYNLSRTVIRSPIDGIVVSRNVSVGQTVAASFQTPTLFVIASNLNDMQVDVSVDEADVGDLRAADQATITVPAFPNVTFHGTVQQVRVNPTVTQNVVTYDAIVLVHDDAARLKPGMTANVTIAVSTHHHVLTVPTAALLYRPPVLAAGTSATPPPVTSAPGSRIVLTVLRDGKPIRVPVVIGASDGSNVEIATGELHEGDAIVVAALQKQRVRAFSPGGARFVGGPGGGR